MRLYEFANPIDEASPGGKKTEVIQVKHERKMWMFIMSHVPEQEAYRGIDRNDIRYVISRVPDFRNKYKPFDVNYECYVWSRRRNVGVGLRRKSDIDGEVAVNVATAINELYQGPYPVFFCD